MAQPPRGLIPLYPRVQNNYSPKRFEAISIALLGFNALTTYMISTYHSSITALIHALTILNPFVLKIEGDESTRRLTLIFLRV